MAGTQERIPTLEEVIEVVAGRVPILFEMKNYSLRGRLEKRFYSTMKQYTGRYAVQSFSPLSLRWFRLNAPEVLRGQLACDLKHVNLEIPRLQCILLRMVMYVIKRLETNVLCRPNFISCEFHRIDTDLLKQLRKKGASILAWTIRNEEQFSNVHPFIDTVIFERFLPEAKHKQKMAV